MYGGSLFARSAAADTRQGQAMQRVNARWGSDALDRAGRESLGMAVCKKKYTPFVFPCEYTSSTTTTNNNNNPKDPENGPASATTTTTTTTTVQVRVERRFGCRAHHALRADVIRQHGCRPGWEPFGQWSLRKATELARKETVRRNKQLAAAAAVEAATTTTTEDEASSLDDDGDEDDHQESSPSPLVVCCLPTHAQNNFRSLCWNGNCLVKHESMFDDVQEECRALALREETNQTGGESPEQPSAYDNSNNNSPSFSSKRQRR